jgi:flagellar motor switch protein FliN
MMDYIDGWISAATKLFAHALAPEAELTELSYGNPGAGRCGFLANLQGSRTGRFTVLLDPAILASPLLGDVADQKESWGALLREVADAAAGELFDKNGEKCSVAEFVESTGETEVSRVFQLRLPGGAWTIHVRDEVRRSASEAIRESGRAAASEEAVPPVALSAGVELLLDVELEAALRFGCREMSLGEVLEIGPGDVVELDRHVADPVDLIVGDKIVARGEVVLVKGNFGLRVTEVAAPRKRLESIRCLF